MAEVFKKIKKYVLFFGMLYICLYIIATLSFALKNTSEKPVKHHKTVQYITVKNYTHVPCTKESLKKYLLDINIKFPRIVYAQAMIESSYLKSKLFLRQNNIFGMKCAKQRPKTYYTGINGYAAYKTWKESVLDYCFLQICFMNNAKTEEDYLTYLKTYAEDKNYITQILKIAKTF